MAFSPSRLRLARRRRRLTKVELAERAGVARETLTRVENGDEVPSDRMVERLSFALQFPVGFFAASEVDLLTADREDVNPEKSVASFRSLRSLRAGDREAALATGELAVLLTEEINRRFALPRVDLPDDLAGVDSDKAADLLRGLWGLGSRPIGNMVHLLEAKGVRVYWLVEDCREVDAFMFWSGPIPFVMLSTMKSGERGRMDAAHELGHLVLHRDGKVCGQEAEQQANAFGGAFLLPRDAFTREAPRTPDLRQLLALKPRWGVSVAAMVRRGFDLGIYSEWQYKSAFIEISRRGWRTQEPEPVLREESLAFHKLLRLMAQRGEGIREIARVLHVPERDVADLIPLTVRKRDQQDGLTPSGHLRILR